MVVVVVVLVVGGGSRSVLRNCYLLLKSNLNTTFYIDFEFEIYSQHTDQINLLHEIEKCWGGCCGVTENKKLIKNDSLTIL